MASNAEYASIWWRHDAVVCNIAHTMDGAMTSRYGDNVTSMRVTIYIGATILTNH